MSSSDSESSSSASDDKEAAVTRKQKKVTETKSKRPTKKARTTVVAKSGPSSAPPLDVATEHDDVEDKKSRQQIYVLLDQASLETVKTRRGTFELLNCDDHRDLCRKHKKNPADYRPDICHQELLALIDSPLNKAGRLRVYVRTNRNVLIEVHPSLRVPRTYKRFAGLMVQLLHKMKIKADGSSTALLKVVKNPFSQYLPPGTTAYGMSARGTLHAPAALARAALPSSQRTTPVCFVVGAMATGSIELEDHPYVERMVSVSEYPLSGAAALSRLLGGIEQHWGIV